MPAKNSQNDFVAAGGGHPANRLSRRRSVTYRSHDPLAILSRYAAEIAARPCAQFRGLGPATAHGAGFVANCPAAARDCVNMNGACSVRHCLASGIIAMTTSRRDCDLSLVASWPRCVAGAAAADRRRRRSPRFPAARSTTSRSTTTSAPSARSPSGRTPRRSSSSSSAPSARWRSSTASGSPSSTRSTARKACRSSASTPTSRTRSRRSPATPASTASSSRCSRTPAPRVADQFGATRTPEAFVLDRAARRALPRPHRRPVRRRRRAEQGDAVRAGRRDRRGARRQAGGRRRRPSPSAASSAAASRAAADGDVTYAKHIAPILQKHCVSCHRAGQIAPFALTDYDDVAAWADMMLEVIDEGRMPPWHANPGHGEFLQRRPHARRGEGAVPQVGEPRRARGRSGRPAAAARVRRRVATSRAARRVPHAGAVRRAGDGHGATTSTSTSIRSFTKTSGCAAPRRGRAIARSCTT